MKDIQYVDLRSHNNRFKYDDLSLLWSAIFHAQRFILSRFERWILYNQYEILSHLQNDEEHINRYQGTMKVLSHGYGLEIEWLSEQMYPEFNLNDCKEVHDILYMYEMIYDT